jgi:transcriptional regulator with XRE-family HTH domain
MAKAIHSARHKRLVELLIQSRRHARLTQAQLAQLLGEHQSFVARLESGERRIDVVELFELARVIGFDPVDVITKLRDETPFPEK